MICYMRCMNDFFLQKFFSLFSGVKSDFGTRGGVCRNGGGGETAVYSCGGRGGEERERERVVPIYASGFAEHSSAHGM